MIIPKKWGQGQLFAFSALDGSSYASDDFVGMLSGDRVGIRFYTNIKRELALVNLRGRNPEFDAVTSDYICFHFPQQKHMRIIYAKPHLIIGNAAGEILPLVFVEGSYQPNCENGIEFHDTHNGEITAFKRIGDRFVFAYAHSKEEVIALIETGFKMDLDKAEATKLAFYKRHGAPDNFPYAELYAKCLSVMKTQLYSPEAEFTTVWSTPDRLPHAHMWLWDSVFHALGHRHMEPSIAEDLISALWIHQTEDGFIPHMVDINQSSSIIQPPVVAWGIWQLYQTSGNKEFLRDAYLHNKRFLNWCRTNRRLSDKELYTWNTTSNINCRCDESGMDNSPRFDVKEPLFAIDFSCFMANEVLHMRKIAQELGLTEDTVFYGAWYDTISKDINAYLWSEEDGFYFDYNITEKKLHKVWSIASFLPLLAGICSESQAACLVAHLQDSESFATTFPIPTISRKDATFGSDMWRGPVWINYNYMISRGLTHYGYSTFADEIIEKTITFMNHWYQATGTIYEFYDCNNEKTPIHLNRKGLPFEPYNIEVRLQSIRDYGWSCTLLFDLLNTKLKSKTAKEQSLGKEFHHGICK